VTTRKVAYALGVEASSTPVKRQSSPPSFDYTATACNPYPNLVSCSRTIAGAQAADVVAPIRVPPPVPPTPLQHELFHQFERQAKVIVQLADNLRAAQGERERWRKVYDKLQQEKASLQREIRERRDRQQRGRSEGEPS